MSFPSFLLFVLKRGGLLVVVVLLGGCATTTPVALEVTSPPAPRIGSGPIAAYDAYASAMFFAAPETETRVSSVGRLSTGSKIMVGQQRPTVVVQAGTD
jgi:hypothetical protein